jgi:hypothetical protein
MSCDPAFSILKICGGPSPVARRLDLRPNTTLRWQYPVEKQGSGGAIPFKYHDPLIALASECGVDLPRGAFADPDIARELLRQFEEKQSAA